MTGVSPSRLSIALVRSDGPHQAERAEVDREVLTGAIGLRLDAAAKRGPPGAAR